MRGRGEGAYRDGKTQKMEKEHGVTVAIFRHEGVIQESIGRERRAAV